MSGIVLSLCDRTGNMVRPWLAAGYECWIVDTQHPAGEHRDGNLVRVGADVLTWLPPRAEYAFVSAFPPCTDLAISGARWMQDKGLAGLAHAVQVVERCRLVCDWSGGRWMIENPVGTLSTYWRKPDFQFDPYDYAGLAYGEMKGEAYAKRTCLWTGGGFVMPEVKPVAPSTHGKVGNVSHSKRRGDVRSVTPTGFAQAVFLANQ